MEAKLITSNQELLDLLPALMRGPVLSIDTETTGLDWDKDIVVGVSFSLDGETGYYVPFAHKEGPQCNYLVVKWVMESLLLNPELTRVFHNSKFDIHQCWTTFGIRAVYPYHDTLIMAFLEDNTIPKGLKFWSDRLWGPELKNLEDELSTLKKSRKALSMGHIPPDLVADYAAGDAIYTLRLFNYFGDQALSNPLYGTELELVDLVIDMERAGVRIDKEFLVEAGKVLDEHLPTIQAELEKLAGWPVNPRSPQQVAKLFYEQFEFPILDYTDTGNPSTAEEVILNLPEHPVIDLVLEARTTSKIKSTYIDGILNQIGSSDYLHCKHNQMGAGTGRFSSSKRNLQNIPREGSVPVSIRGAFIPSPGRFLLFLDYKQVEMYVFAHYVNDPLLLAKVREGYDFHKTTASAVLEIALDQVTKAQRKWAKSINFGYIFGIGVTKLAMRLRCSKPKARGFLRDYDRKFPGIPVFMKKCKADFQQLGYVENLFGRRRKIPYDKAYRSVNTLVQGTAADIIKDAMVRLKPILKVLETKLIMTVHDELIFDMKYEEAWAVPEIVSIMEDFNLRVPIRVDIEWSPTNWADKRDWETFSGVPFKRARSQVQPQ